MCSFANRANVWKLATVNQRGFNYLTTNQPTKSLSPLTLLNLHIHPSIHLAFEWSVDAVFLKGPCCFNHVKGEVPELISGPTSITEQTSGLADRKGIPQYSTQRLIPPLDWWRFAQSSPHKTFRVTLTFHSELSAFPKLSMPLKLTLHLLHAARNATRNALCLRGGSLARPAEVRRTSWWYFGMHRHCSSKAGVFPINRFAETPKRWEWQASKVAVIYSEYTEGFASSPKQKGPQHFGILVLF